jgi:hypothetical protein
MVWHNFDLLCLSSKNADMLQAKLKGIVSQDRGGLEALVWLKRA